MAGGVTPRDLPDHDGPIEMNRHSFAQYNRLKVR
jgi:hypothetical protein